MAVKFTNVQIITPTGIRTGEVVTEGELIADVSFGKWNVLVPWIH